MFDRQFLFWVMIIVLAAMVAGPIVWQWIVARNAVPKSPASPKIEKTPERLAGAARTYLAYLRDRLPAEATTSDFLVEVIENPEFDVEQALRELVVRNCKEAKCQDPKKPVP